MAKDDHDARTLDLFGPGVLPLVMAPGSPPPGREPTAPRLLSKGVKTVKASEVYPSRFVCAGDLKGKDVTVTIARVELEKFDDGRQKPIVYFKKMTKGLVCNKTNWMTIAEICGEDSDDWPGKDITLASRMVDFKGKTVEAIRVEKAPEPVAPATVETQQDDDLDDEIVF